MIGDKDAYHCATCNSIVVTIERDRGRVPETIRCFAARCNGTMRSQHKHFDRELRELRAEFQWIRPTKGDLQRARKAGLRSFVQFAAQGGLKLVPWMRPLTPGGNAAFSKRWSQAIPVVQARLAKEKEAEDARLARERADAERAKLAAEQGAP